MKLSTLCFLLKDDQILLAMKKRGFGEGKWNGVGGKVDEGEGIKHAALREVHEEIGVTASEGDLEAMGMLHFRSATNKKLNWDVHIFFLRVWHGEPQESEEMRPQWYFPSQLPFSEMWPDDRHWLPRVLAGERIVANFEFDATDKDFLNISIRAL